MSETKHNFPGGTSYFFPWVDHETPVNAINLDWIGFEFHQVEYNIGTNAQGGHGTLKGRFENNESRISAVEGDYVKKLGGSFEGHVGFNYYRIEYSYIFSCAQINFTGEGITAIGIKDEDDMSTDSDKHLATQQSIKKYTDDEVTTLKDYIDNIHASKARAYRTAALTLNGWTKVPLDTENFDNLGEYDNTTNYRFTAQTAGYYLVVGSVGIASMNNNQLGGMSIYKNGAPANYYYHNVGDVTSNQVMNSTDIIYLNGSTDYIELYGYCATAKPVVVGSLHTFMSIHKLS